MKTFPTLLSENNHTQVCIFVYSVRGNTNTSRIIIYSPTIGFSLSVACILYDLGMLLDSELANTSFFHLCHLGQLKGYVTLDALNYLVAAVIASSLDYCNSVLAIAGRSTYSLPYSIGLTRTQQLDSSWIYHQVTVRVHHWRCICFTQSTVAHHCTLVNFALLCVVVASHYEFILWFNMLYQPHRQLYCRCRTLFDM